MNGKRNFFVRAVAIAIVVIMILGVGVAAIQSLAADADLIVATGGNSEKWPYIVGIGSVLLIAVCVLIPKLSAKKNGNNGSVNKDTEDKE